MENIMLNKNLKNMASLSAFILTSLMLSTTAQSEEAMTKKVTLKAAKQVFLTKEQKAKAQPLSLKFKNNKLASNADVNTAVIADEVVEFQTEYKAERELYLQQRFESMSAERKAAKEKILALAKKNASTEN
jgi:regulatory protein YycI of two-component signal transduction system YycFG